MYCKVISGTIMGAEGIRIDVEADLSDGLPAFNMVGMLSSEVKEAGERVRTALKNSDFRLPPKRITVNLSPADIRKAGSAFDLPIAVAVLADMGFVAQDNIKNMLIIGELSLSGEVNRVNGILPIVCMAAENGIDTCIVPHGNEREAVSVVKGIKVLGVSSLKEAVKVINEVDSREYVKYPVNECVEVMENMPDFSEVAGQEALKRAAEVAAAGMHNFLMSGPPGSGKTMIASRMPSILPEISKEERLEVMKVYSVAGLLDINNPIMTHPPFRAPHHTITRSAMIGGGRWPLPGEISLANNGVLFLDELPEFSQPVLEVLRQPLEEGKITISRVFGNSVYPSRFMLLAAMNPCKCGYYPDRTRCKCTTEQVRKYLGKISRPLLDRIDIFMEVPRIEFSQISGNNTAESSETIRGRVKRAREIQKQRYKNENYLYNGHLDAEGVKKYCVTDNECKALVEKVYEKLGLTARSYHKLLKVARTVADLDESSSIERRHLSEALLYKSNMENKYMGGHYGE